MKLKFLSLRFTLVAVIALITTFAMSKIQNNTMSFTKNENDDEFLVENILGDENNNPLDFWEIDEFEKWMEQQHAKNQELANSGDKSFYEKNTDGNYICREWTQKDVDALYMKWQEQIALMKQGYHFTKSITLPDGGVLVGTFDPETWNAKPSTALGSTIITLPNGSAVNLGHFDTADEAAKAVSKYLIKQIANGELTQQQADTILEHGTIKQAK